VSQSILRNSGAVGGGNAGGGSVVGGAVVPEGLVVLGAIRSSRFINQFVLLNPERELILEVEPFPFVHSNVSLGKPFCSRAKLPGNHGATLWLLNATAIIGPESEAPERA